jgi:hypothetical protein
LSVAPRCVQTAEQSEAHGISAVNTTYTTYHGKTAVRIYALPTAANGQSYAIPKGSRFHNGTIEVDLAGKPAVNPFACARGFIGIAFRMQGNRQSKITQ